MFTLDVFDSSTSGRLRPMNYIIPSNINTYFLQHSLHRKTCEEIGTVFETNMTGNSTS